jgi:peptidoglycan/LPS O-acetylase OafA/YrhL
VGLLLSEMVLTLAPTPDALKPIAPHFEWFFLRRYFEWFLGMWLAERLAAGKPLERRFGVLALVSGFGYGVTCSHIPAAWPLHELCLALGSFGLVALAVAPAAEPSPTSLRGRFRRLFGWFGDCSYSLYLVHMPVMRLINAAVCQLPDLVREHYGYAIFGAASVVTVLLTARVWYVLFEKPYLTPPPTT